MAQHHPISLSALDARTLERQLQEGTSLPACEAAEAAEAVAADLLRLEDAFRAMHGRDEIRALRGCAGGRGDLFCIGITPFGSEHQLRFRLEMHKGVALLADPADILLASGRMEHEVEQELRRRHPGIGPVELRALTAARLDAKSAGDRELCASDIWIDSADCRYTLSFSNYGSSSDRPAHSLIVAAPSMRRVIDLRKACLRCFDDDKPAEQPLNAFALGLLRAAARDLASWGWAVV